MMWAHPMVVEAEPDEFLSGGVERRWRRLQYSPKRRDGLGAGDSVDREPPACLESANGGTRLAADVPVDRKVGTKNPVESSLQPSNVHRWRPLALDARRRLSAF